MKNLLKNISKIFIILTVMLQPLHSYSVIHYSDNLIKDEIGMKHLDAKMCGSKYSSEFSPQQTISNAIDDLNTFFLSEISEKCVCCESIDISSIDKIISHIDYKYYLTIIADFSYQSSNSQLIEQINLNTLSVRAPPVA